MLGCSCCCSCHGTERREALILSIGAYQALVCFSVVGFGMVWRLHLLLWPSSVTWQKPKRWAVFPEGLLYKIISLQTTREGIIQHLILCQGRGEEPVLRIRAVLLESKGLHVMLHLTTHSLVKGPEGRSILSPTAHVKRGKVTTKEMCSLVSFWICPNVAPLI